MAPLFATLGLLACAAIGIWRYWGGDRTRDDRLLSEEEERQHTAQWFGTRGRLKRGEQDDW